MLMIDVLTSGFDAIRALAEDPSIKVPLHIHRTMHAAMTRNPDHGIAMRPFARLVRMAGGDQLHTGTASGKMGHASVDEIRGDNEALLCRCYGLKQVFPVSSGGLHPGKVGAELAALGTDLVLQAGGGSTGIPGVRPPEPARCGRPPTRSWRECRSRSTRRTTTSSNRRSGNGGLRRPGPEASAPR